MKVARIWLVAVLAVIALVLSAEPASAQFGSLKKKAEDKAKKEAEKKVDPAKPAETAAPGETPQTSDASAPAPAEPGKGAWLNYDFVPGSRVLFFDDFMVDQVGNFPQRFEFIEGNMEVAEWNKERWLRSSTRSKFSIPLPETLPTKFTIEFDIYTGSAGWNSVAVVGGDPAASQTAVYMDITNRFAGLREYGGNNIAMGKVAEAAYAQVTHGRVMADGPYMKVYVNENRVANVPKVNFIRSNSLRFEIEAEDQRPLMLANFRVAASDKTMYDAIAATGRCTTHGILFNSGSDRIRPESTPTLKEIGQMLKDHPDLKLAIEGHTDNVGEDASNQTLSEKRAAAVRAFLVAEHGIDGGRLESKGFGEANPCASNDSQEGRQNNRRVELVKI